MHAGVDPGFLEQGGGGFRCVEEGSWLCCFYVIFLKYPMKMK